MSKAEILLPFVSNDSYLILDTKDYESALERWNRNNFKQIQVEGNETVFENQTPCSLCYRHIVKDVERRGVSNAECHGCPCYTFFGNQGCNEIIGKVIGNDFFCLDLHYEYIHIYAYPNDKDRRVENITKKMTEFLKQEIEK